jgi:hypothetical protein
MIWRGRFRKIIFVLQSDESLFFRIELDVECVCECEFNSNMNENSWEKASIATTEAAAAQGVKPTYFA